MSLTATAWNNTRFQVSFDVSAWAVAYDLSAVEWMMQIRQTAASPQILLDLTTTNGGAVYAAGVVVFEASRAAVSAFLGACTFDFGFTPTGGDFVRCDGGSIAFEQGVSR